MSASSKAATVKMRTQPNLKRTAERNKTQKALKPKPLPKNRTLGREAPELVMNGSSTSTKPMAPLYRWMTRIVLSLAFIAFILTIALFFFAR